MIFVVLNKLKFNANGWEFVLRGGKCAVSHTIAEQNFWAVKKKIKLQLGKLYSLWIMMTLAYLFD